GVDHDGRVRKQRCSFRVVVAAEAEDRRRTVERFREIWKRRDTDAAADEQRLAHVEAEAVAERPEDSDFVARLELGERTRAGTDRVDQERKLAARRETEAHRTRQHAAGCLEHEELSWTTSSEGAARDAQQRVRPDPLDGDDTTTLARHASPAARAPTRLAP